MTATIIGIVALVVALIVGPFAALRAVSYYRARRTPASSSSAAGASKDDEENPDDKSGFW